ncbi:acid protease [Pleomassaria siparia CBS 279.74]|uniref:Acid protease n=1 Tax=Pleomassaria siparia CBS 279.74 TaxID=1314801 RepID=A0A6G1JUK0_9PLEO|nr:acid protease [Pleomassaria siparia CBS 279.74]
MKSTLATLTTVALSTSTALAQHVFMPLNFRYGYNHKVSTDLYSPSTNTTIEVVVDTGSENFLLFGPNSIDNWGLRCLACQGPCNVSVPVGSYYDDLNSATAGPRQNFSASYVFGGADKIYTGDYAVNDTFAFTNAAGLKETVDDVKVALMQFLVQRVEDPTCANPPAYDLGILGIAPYYSDDSRNTSGPSFRQHLLERKAISAPVQSMWFDKAPAAFDGTFTGGSLFGGIDTSKYTGDLVKVINRASSGQVGYYVAPPVVSVNGVSFSSNETDATAYCQLDSGTHDDTLSLAPNTEAAFFAATNITNSPSGYIAYNGTCDSIPADLTIDLTFPGATAGKSVTVKVPVKSYARILLTSNPEFCYLSISTNEYASCMLGAPFSTAAFFAADDERSEVALAQGGVTVKGDGVKEGSVVVRIP